MLSDRTEKEFIHGDTIREISPKIRIASKEITFKLMHNGYLFQETIKNEEIFLIISSVEVSSNSFFVEWLGNRTANDFLKGEFVTIWL